MSTVLVDANNLAMRAVFAMRGQTLSSHGVNTGPLLVFARMLDRYARYTKPSRMALCWDAGPSWRIDVDPEYKANRLAAPDEDVQSKHDTFRLMREWISLNNIPSFSLKGFEADDLVAEFVRQTRLESHKVWIISGDKDLLQLVEGDHVLQIRPTVGLDPEQEVWNEERVRAHAGASRSSLTLVNALVGDTSDNIQGVSGIGPKRAAKLIETSQGSIETLVESERCREHKDRILRNLVLMDLRRPTVVPTLPTLPIFRPTSHDSIGWSALQAFLRGYGLSSLLETVIGGEVRQWQDFADTEAT